MKSLIVIILLTSCATKKVEQKPLTRREIRNQCIENYLERVNQVSDATAICKFVIVGE